MVEESEDSSDEEKEERQLEVTKEKEKNIARACNVQTAKKSFWTSMIEELFTGWVIWTWLQKHFYYCNIIAHIML